MSRSYPIWNKVTACIYGSDKSWGAKSESNVEILVGSSSNNSHLLCRHRTTKTQNEQGNWVFEFIVDGETIKKMEFLDNNGRPGEVIK